MNKEKFQDLLKNPTKVEGQDLNQLQEIIRDYPYFHNAHLLLLYCLRQQNSNSFEEQLSASSLHLSSRTDLVKAIYQGWPTAVLKESPEPVIAKDVILTPVTETDIPDKEAPLQELEIETQALRDNLSCTKPTDEEKAREFTFEENFTFSLEDAQAIETFDRKEEESAERLELPSDLLEFDLGSLQPEDAPKEDLIEHFLKVNPRIVPKLDLDDKRGDISMPGLEENDEILTETLADIYEKQGHYHKAKEAYQKLILKYPEKSAYFAGRIQEIEKLIK